MDTESSLFHDYKAVPDKERLVRLLSAHQDSVYNLCYQVLRNSSDAEDASQNAFLKILEGLPGVSDPLHFKRWVRRVCLSVCVDLQRSRGRRVRHEQERTPTMDE